MKKFETRYIGNDLYEVVVDGEPQPVPYKLTEIAQLYEDLWYESQKEEANEEV